MKNCPNCHIQINDEAVFCPNCGASVAGASQPQGQPNYQQPPVYSQPVPTFDPYDHTAEYDPKDISDNKVISMLVYLLGAVGIVIALLASSTSKYVGFHLRQALKFTVVEILLALITVVLCWTFIVPIAAGVCCCILFVLKVIAFFQICSGKAKEPAIIRSLGFLK